MNVEKALPTQRPKEISGATLGGEGKRRDFKWVKITQL